MTSREMILATILHKNPDKVPVDLVANPSSGISAIAYSNLLKHIGRPEFKVKIKINNVSQSMDSRMLYDQNF